MLRHQRQISRLGAVSLSSAVNPAPRGLSPHHCFWPSHSELKCTNHAVEAEEHPKHLTNIVHYRIENGGGQRAPLIIYGENMKAQERISDGSSNTNEWSHSWEMRKPRKRTEKIIVNGIGTIKSL